MAATRRFAAGIERHGQDHRANAGLAAAVHGSGHQSAEYPDNRVSDPDFPRKGDSAPDARGNCAETGQGREFRLGGVRRTRGTPFSSADCPNNGDGLTGTKMQRSGAHLIGESLITAQP